MTRLVSHCALMFTAAIALAVLLLVSGMQAVALLVIIPALLCVGLPLAMDPGDPRGEEILAAARRASGKP